MLTLARRCLCFEHRVRLAISLFCSVYSTSPAGSAVAARTRPVRKGTIVTKKQFADLPVPRGERAETVAKLARPTKRRSITASATKIDVTTATGEQVEDSILFEKDQTRDLAVAQEHLEDDAAEQVKQAPKARKTRKTRTKRKTQTDDDAIPADQPRNQLATEILRNLSVFPHCLLLTRVGQFYESYFDQAAEISRLLNIKLTSRQWDGHRILMCGFPLAHLDKYLKILVQQNKRFVAMCEEFPRAAASETKAGFDRRVVRVITPGTLINEPFVNQYVNNYLLAIRANKTSYAPSSVGLAWIDVSTGEFFVKTSDSDSVRDELARISPREVILDRSLEDCPSHPIRVALMEFDIPTSYIVSEESNTPPFQGSETTDNITTDMSRPRVAALSSIEVSAVGLLTTFLHAHLLEHMPQLSLPNREAKEGRMQIDAHTIQALEIRHSFGEGGVVGSLFNVIKRTVTNGGTRLLARWLCSPSTSIKEINARQSLVAFFHARPHLRIDLTAALASTEDVTRTVQKFLLGRGDLPDLFTIKSTISVWSSIRERVERERTEGQADGTIDLEHWSSIDALIVRMCNLEELSQKISCALRSPSSDSEEPFGVEPSEGEMGGDQLSTPFGTAPRHEGWTRWMIQPSFTSTLQELHQRHARLLASREELQQRLRHQYGAPSLTLRSSPAHGMHVHLGKAKRDKKVLESSGHFTRIAESGSTRCYFYEPWTTLGVQILDTTTALMAAEKDAFDLLRNEIIIHSDPLRRNARIIDELDVTLAFACLANEMNFVRPVITEDNSYEVHNGRHPTVELGLLRSSRVFMPNSVALTSRSHLHVITGPNMAGKSTFLRQTALIAILAQIGSFVPADFATIGLVDQVFSRIGAQDDLFRDKSTFMVEMLETAEILRRATPNSLVIMDEVGRGTTVQDGLAIAFATIHHLVTVNGCRALFATHFHELADMLGCTEDNKGQGVFENVSFFCTDIDESPSDHTAYSYRLSPGVSRDSHGLKVAQLAGMPISAVSVARAVLQFMKSRDPQIPSPSVSLSTLQHIQKL